MNHEQRKRFWAMLGDVSQQVKWPVNGELGRMDKEDWRLVFCAAYRQEKRIADGLNGGQVVLGLRLRDIFAGMNDETAKRTASDLIELITAFGAERSVSWSNPETVSPLASAS